MSHNRRYIWKFWLLSMNCHEKLLVLKKCLSCIDMYKFQAKWSSYGYFRGIVCDKILIFGTYVCLGMGDNGAKGIINLFLQISFSIVFKHDFFTKQVSKTCCKITHLIVTKISPYLIVNPQVLGIFLISI